LEKQAMHPFPIQTTHVISNLWKWSI
jgi:hypothetical protein